MKGFIQTLEQTLGSILILTMLITLFNPSFSTSHSQLSNVGFNCLKDLDNQGPLRNYAANNMTTNLNTSLQQCLSAFNYDFKICSSPLDCSTNLPTNKDIFLSSYFIAGDTAYKPTLINLWVWLK